MLAALSQRARVAILGAVATALAFFVFGGGRGRSGSVDPESAVPRDSFLVATVKLAELRRSPIYEVLLGKEGKEGSRGMRDAPLFSARALGIGELSDACGFDPLTRVSELAVAVPEKSEDGEKGDFGVAAHVDVTTDELARCAAALAERRGGKVETRDIGSFTVVESGSEARPGQGSGRPRLAYGHGGLLVVGRGAWFEAMLAAADRKRPSAKEADGHAALRTTLTSREGWRSPTVLVTALLPKSLRDRLKSEMGAEVPQDSSQSLMAGVLGVSSAGLALRAGGTGQNIDAAVELVCDSDEACAAVEKLILKKRLEWTKELMLRMVGLGPILDSLAVKRDGSRLHVVTSAAADGLAAAVDRVLRFSGPAGHGASKRSTPSTPSTPGTPSTASVRSADETIRAPRPTAQP